MCRADDVVVREVLYVFCRRIVTTVWDVERCLVNVPLGMNYAMAMKDGYDYDMSS
jgi:hypothetical protein